MLPSSSMPTTIERRCRWVGRALSAPALVLAGWFTLMTSVTAVTEPASVVAFGPPQRLLTSLEPGKGSLLNAGPFFVRARAEQPGFVRRLYRSGAWLVLPAPGLGCLPPRST